MRAAVPLALPLLGQPVVRVAPRHRQHQLAAAVPVPVGQLPEVTVGAGLALVDLADPPVVPLPPPPEQTPVPRLVQSGEQLIAIDVRPRQVPPQQPEPKMVLLRLLEPLEEPGVQPIRERVVHQPVDHVDQQTLWLILHRRHDIHFHPLLRHVPPSGQRPGACRALAHRSTRLLARQASSLRTVVYISLLFMHCQL